MSIRFEVQNIRLTFGTQAVLQDVSLGTVEGRCVGIIGPNGAGKTSLFDVMSGFVAPNAGRVILDGREVTGRSPVRIARLGVRRTFQGDELFDDLTVIENLVAAGCTFQHGLELLELLELQNSAALTVGSMPAGLRRLVGLGRALAGKPSALLVDEPASGMVALEVERLVIILHRIQREFDLGMLVVDHDMTFIRSLCDIVHVLDRGAQICHGPPEAVLADPRVLEVYLGI